MKLTFFPWVRQGLATAIGNAAGAARPAVNLSVDVRRGSGPLQTIGIDAELYGPGDVLSLERRAVIRTWPAAGMSIEDDQLAAVDFDRADLPWLFSPRAPQGDVLLPWLQLIVVEPGPGVRLTSRPSQNAVLELEGAEVVRAQLPDPGEAWAFAHAQLAGEDTVDASQLAQLLRDRPGQSSSRLLAARKLERGTRYVACLVPTWEPGRRAGLGLPSSGAEMRFAWSTTATDVELPVYFSWSFDCSPDAGFLELVEKLQPEDTPDDPELPGDLGRRSAFAAKAPSLRKGFPFEVPSLFRSLTLRRGRAEPPAAADSARFGAAIAALQRKRRTLAPPRYGSAHAPGGEWVDVINRDPALRAVAGLGARVVQLQQEALVAAVWEQLEKDPPVEEHVAERVRASLRARVIGSGQQVKASGEIAARLLWSTTRATVSVPRTLAPAAPGPPAAPAVMLPAVRRLAVIAGRSSLLSRLVKPPPPPPPDPGIATFEDASVLSPTAVSVEAIDGAPGAPRFDLAGPEESPGPPSVAPVGHILIGGIDNAAAQAFRAAARTVQAWLNGLLPPPRPGMRAWVRAQLIDITAFGLTKLRAAEHSSAGPTSGPTSRPTSGPPPPPTPVAPEPTSIEITIPQNALGVRHPMWKVLHELDPEAVLAHDEEIHMNRVALLELVPEVHEAFLAGLNHELLREVRWRRIPVQGAPTFFDTLLNDGLPEVPPLEEWSAGPHVAKLWREVPVLLLRGEVVRAQPRVIVYAQSVPPAAPGGARPASSVLAPLYSGQLDVSTRFFGFGIPVKDLARRELGWRFVFEEPPTEPCFQPPPGASPGPLPAESFGAASAALLAQRHLKRRRCGVLSAIDLLPGGGP